MLHQTAQVRQQILDHHRGARRSLRKMLDVLAAAKSVGGWVPSLWRFARRPRLHVYFDAAQTYMIRTVTDAGGVPGYFCHVMVRNDGHDVARKCRGRLTAVLQRDADGRTAPAPGFVAPVVLKWAHELDWNWNPRDIEHDVRRRLDLCYALQSAPQQLRFFSHPVPSGVQTIFPPGLYTVRIRVDAQNAADVEGTFDIDFTHGWSQITITVA